MQGDQRGDYRYDSCGNQSDIDHEAGMGDLFRGFDQIVVVFVVFQ